MDIAHPGKSAPSTTSKPVIVTNRPVLQDPMVVTTPETDSLSESKSEAAQPISVHKSGGLVLQPLSAKPEAEEMPAPTESTKAESTEINLPLDEILSKTKQDDAEKSEEAETEPVAAQDQPETVPVNAVETAEKPAAEANEPKSTEAEPPKAAEEKQEQAEPAPVSEALAEKPLAPKLSPVAHSAGVPTKDGALIDEDDADQAAAEHAAKIEKLVETKQYFLPVDAVEKRRTKRVIALGILLAIVLGAAWLDIALDAGILQLGNIHAVTNFF